MINNLTMLNPRYFNRPILSRTDSISFSKSNSSIWVTLRGAIGRYGGILEREPKFTPLKRRYLPLASRNHLLLFENSRALSAKEQLSFVLDTVIGVKPNHIFLYYNKNRHAM